MTRFVLLTVCTFFISIILSGCHAEQERAWREAMEAGEAVIAADEFLSDNVVGIELERRQFVRIYIKSQKARPNFLKITAKVGEAVGEKLFSDEGNKLKKITIFGNLEDGDELIVMEYSAETKLQTIKDRTMHGM